MQVIVSTVEGLQHEVKHSHISVEKMQVFSTQLEVATSLLKQPVQYKLVHHHHVPKIIWIAVGLFFILAFVSSGWYVTNIKLDSYITNDTKYRALRLDTARRILQLYLDRADSSYNARPDMRKAILQTEEEYRQNFERLQRAERLKAEAKDLERWLRKTKFLGKVIKLLNLWYKHIYGTKL